jgi:hypothetical protein
MPGQIVVTSGAMGGIFKGIGRIEFMKPEVMFLHRIKLYGAMLSLFLFSLGVWSPMADATVLKQADFETGGMSQVTSYDSQATPLNRADTFSNFGISRLTGGGTYCASANSNSGIDDANHILFLYNQYPIQNVWYRMYFYVPSGFVADSGASNSLKFIMFLNNSQTFEAGLHLYQTGNDLYLKWFHVVGAQIPFGNVNSVSISRGAWHYLEVNTNIPNGTVSIWLDSDARTQSATWTNAGVGDLPYYFYGTTTLATINVLEINENWSGGLAPATEAWYVDGLAWASSVVGDTYGLMGTSGPPGDTTPPTAPTGLIVQ